MPLTRPDIERVADFCDARLDDLFAGLAGIERSHGTGGTSRSVRALRSAVTDMRLRGALLDPEPGSGDASVPDGTRYLVALFAWDGLCRIAEQWQDHPHYSRDFTPEPPCGTVEAEGAPCR
jgi:hypothetical protein